MDFVIGGRATIVILISLGAALASGASRAQTKAVEPDAWDNSEDHEWSIGVPQEKRASARALFAQGRDFYRESLMVAAVEKYTESLTIWDHPSTHYNLALALIPLDRPLDLREHLIASLKYGPWPLKQFRFDHAKNYQAVLESQLVKFRVRCDVPGAQVTLDGQELFKPPGEAARWAKAGHHVVTATKDGFIANQVARSFVPGARPNLELKLSTQDELTVYSRRWSPALPWSVMGSGAAVALSGGGLLYAGREAAKAADGTLGSQCPEGCKPAPSRNSAKRAESQRLQKLAIGAFIVGGATLVTGTVLGYMNRTHPSVRSYEPDIPTATQPALSVAPLIDNNVRGVVATGTF